MWKDFVELNAILLKLEPDQRQGLLGNLKAIKELYESTTAALHRAYEKLSEVTFYDQLTNIPKRKYYEEHFDRILAQAQRNNIKFSLLYLELDQFKSINDKMRHRAGDVVLKTIAKRFEPILRTNDFIARLWGDEFCLVASNYTDEKQVDIIARRLIERFSYQIKVGSMGVRLTYL